MNEPEQQVDDVVRAYLQRHGQASDPAAGLQRVRATLEREAATRPPQHFWTGHHRRRGWWTAAAAVVLAAFVGSFYVGPAQATNETLVREALHSHSLPVDRCYLVENKKELGGLDPRQPSWIVTRPSRLWTRGDRFWIHSTVGQRQWNWGRDKEGRIWLAVSPNRGVRFENNEAPEALALVCDVYSMKVETLLGDVLADFDLHREKSEPGSYQLRAELKPGHSHPTLRSARLEIDAESKVLRRVVLARSFRGRPITTEFTLIDSQTVDGGQYDLEGHLNSSSQIYTRDFQPERRRLLVHGLLGQRATEPLPERQPPETGPDGNRP